jgi:hypothetical protein
MCVWLPQPHRPRLLSACWFQLDPEGLLWMDKITTINASHLKSYALNLSLWNYSYSLFMYIVM